MYEKVFVLHAILFREVILSVCSEQNLNQMEEEEIGILQQEDVKTFLRIHLQEADPAHLALTQKDNAKWPALVYSQLKIWQKAQKKLPSWVEAGCIFTTRGFAQASSEKSAALKPWQGNRCLDLTMGMGVDTVHFASQFEHVEAVEPDPVLRQLAKHNFAQLGLGGLEVHAMDAAQFLANYRGEKFDLIYVDPDRRDAQEKRIQSPWEGSPNLRKLWKDIVKNGRKLVIKASPLYDVEQALRDVPGLQKRIVVSVDGEVKELLLEIDLDQQESEAHLAIWMGGKNTLILDPIDKKNLVRVSDQVPEPGTYIYEPDAAFYAAHCVGAHISQELSTSDMWVNHPHGYYISEKYTKRFPGRVFEVREVLAYKPKMLKKYFQKRPLLVTQRHFPFSNHHIRQATGIPDGGTDFLLCTQFGRNRYAILADRLH